MQRVTNMRSRRLTSTSISVIALACCGLLLLFLNLSPKYIFTDADNKIKGNSCLLSLLHNVDMKVFSQQGEDGILLNIFSCIGTTNKYFVEFGVEAGIECNTRFLREYHGFNGLMMDGSYENPEINLRKEFFWPDNIVELFRKYKVPRKFDLLSVDTDMFDFYTTYNILRAGYQPRVIVMEINKNFDDVQAFTVFKSKVGEKRFWSGTCYYGLSLGAAVILANHYGYEFVATDNKGINAFFVHKEISGHLPQLNPSAFSQFLSAPQHYDCNNMRWLDVAKVSNFCWLYVGR